MSSTGPEREVLAYVSVGPRDRQKIRSGQSEKHIRRRDPNMNATSRGKIMEAKRTKKITKIRFEE